jgi:hypothetical protein
MRNTILKGVLLVVGMAALMMVFGSPALAAEDTAGKMIGPSMEIKKEAIDRPSLGVRDDVVVPELTKEFERPMSVPEDPRSNMVYPGRDPLCGPWKNAINHYACGKGYESLAF